MKQFNFKESLRQNKAFIFFWLCILIMLWFSSGCNTAQKQITKMQLFAVKYPTDFLQLSAKLNPCISGITKSDTVIKRDTAMVAGETVTNTVTKHDSVFITKTIQLPGKTITILKTIHDTTIQADTRALNAAQAMLSDCNIKASAKDQSLIDANKNKSIWMWTAIGCILLIVIFGVIKVYTFFSTGGVTNIIKKI